MSLFGISERKELIETRKLVDEYSEMAKKLQSLLNYTFKSISNDIIVYEKGKMGAKPCLMRIKGYIEGLRASTQ